MYIFPSQSNSVIDQISLFALVSKRVKCDPVLAGEPNLILCMKPLAQSYFLIPPPFRQILCMCFVNTFPHPAGESNLLTWCYTVSHIYAL